MGRQRIRTVILAHARQMPLLRGGFAQPPCHPDPCRCKSPTGKVLQWEDLLSPPLCRL